MTGFLFETAPKQGIGAIHSAAEAIYCFHEPVTRPN